ncbi:MAG: beta-propeller domain-containing protein [Polyangiales bacterium]
MSRATQCLLGTLIISVLQTHAVACGTSRRSGAKPSDARNGQSTHAQRNGTQLERFKNEAEFREYVTAVRELQRKQDLQRRGGAGAPAQMESQGYAAEASAAEDDGGAADSVTNTQEAGVDEGGIVKVYKGYLVVLRRGRLFSVRLGDKSMRPVSRIDVPEPGRAGGWYDEMLLHKGTIVVIGYNYKNAGTELSLFRIDGRGQIKRRQTYYLRSKDYYSSRNYASRLLGSRLIFYMPSSFIPPGSTQSDALEMPALRRGRGPWRDTLQAHHVYKPIQPSPYPVLHTIVQCDLAKPRLACSSQAIVGPPSRNFYVSPRAVYVWVTGGLEEEDGEVTDSAIEEQTPEPEQPKARAVLYRLPLDGSSPGALSASGSPTDQFSFKESSDGHLNVLLRADQAGEGMWGAEYSAGDVALLRVPLGVFRQGMSASEAKDYTALPRPTGQGYAFQNRFVGDYVLYGLGSGWGQRSGDEFAPLTLYHLRSGHKAVRLSLSHTVDRLEAMGHHAMVVGTSQRGLHFSSIRLQDKPTVASSYVQASASQGETRSHGFFYSPQSKSEGLLALPIRGGGAPGWMQLEQGSAGIAFLRAKNLKLTPVGLLKASGRPTQDQCLASCTDWYGNARPLFYRGRLLALLGYELVEGKLRQGKMREQARVNFYEALR